MPLSNIETSIGDYAFGRCYGLTSVTIGNSVTRIGKYAFYGCTGLENITIGNNVTSIGDLVFNGCNKAKFYVHRGTPTLLALWQQKTPYTIYDIETGNDMSKWYELTASSIRINNFEPADGYTKVSESAVIAGVEQNCLKGQRPGQNFSYLVWKIQLANTEKNL